MPTNTCAAAARPDDLTGQSEGRSRALGRGRQGRPGRLGGGASRPLALLGSAAALCLVSAPTAAAQAGHPAKVKTSAGAAAEAGRWALLIALAFLAIGIPVIAWAVSGLVRALRGRRKGSQEPALWWGRSLVVGEDNRVSTSKTTALLWTYSVAAALLSFLIARWLGHSGAFHVLSTQGLNAQYAALIGGPIGAAILAKGIVSAQVSSGQTAKTPAAAPTAAQLVQNDNGQADLGDVQYVLFNFIALAFFYGELLRVPQLGMPTIPDVLVGLTGVSAAGFVGKKVLSGPAGISDVTPKAGHVGDLVTIATAGIIQSADDLPGVTVSFGDAQATRGTLTAKTTTSLGVLIEAPVPASAAGCVDVTVSVPSAQPSAWTGGFKVCPRIAPGQNFAAQPGGTLTVTTSGVSGLGPELPNLRVTIGDVTPGVDAPTALSGDGDLLVTVPENAQTGTTTLALETPGGSDKALITIHPKPTAPTTGAPRPRPEFSLENQHPQIA
jgi:hypothetical protein